MPQKPSAERKTFFQLFPQLFLFPLLIVTVAVLVWLLFVASAQDNRSVAELISDLQVGGAHARKQDAYTLAQKAKATTGKDEYFSAENTRQLLALVDQVEKRGDDPELLKFLTLAVGRAGRPEMTVPVMTRLALDETSPPEARVQATWALGLSRSPQAAETLMKVVEMHSDAASWEFRWNALAGLSNLGEPDAQPLLRRALEDPRRELRWSAACWLANVFNDASGVDTLRSLVDWSFLDEQRGEQGQLLTHEQKEGYLLQALEGLARVQGEGALDVIEEKASEDRSPKVRNAALKLKGEILAGRENGVAEAR